ncbi:MAG: dynamin family protein [Magnetococcales bacterium]|nr:dynamin family protein [Magnetococcales bacterium]
MLTSRSSQIDLRLNSLEKHLKEENPILLRVVQSFRELDRVAYSMGLLHREESYAARVPWWPLVSILGTFSSGKSTFINDYLRQPLQRTGNQAVDDKFTVICYSKEDKIHTLPGLALDADPRFPFYRISRDLEQVVVGEGRRIDAYLQLKTCPTEHLRGKIVIDSPGFDADAQRTSTLRITDHIMDLSDLVLVFFDARHPEPGAMRDTLVHLVANTINRHDSNKFLFILNQIDCTAREDNLEDVTAAWQRALAQAGLTAGRFYQIYNKDCANPFPDPNTKERFEAKRAEDMSEILQRIHRVEVERAYRIIGVMEHTAKMIQDEVVPMVNGMVSQWRKSVLITDGILGLLLLALGGYLWHTSPGLAAFFTNSLALQWSPPAAWSGAHVAAIGGWGLVLAILLTIHQGVRNLTAKSTLRKTIGQVRTKELKEAVTNAFQRNTRPLRSLFATRPAGWNPITRSRIRKAFKDAALYVQDLNDQFTNPSGRTGQTNPAAHLEAGGA